jgi:hypothetical protein
MAPTDVPADVAAAKPMPDAKGKADATAVKPAVASKGKADAPASGPPARPPPVPYRQLFRYATRLDMALNGFAFICAVFAGAVFPCFALLFVSGLQAAVLCRVRTLPATSSSWPPV